MAELEGSGERRPREGVLPETAEEVAEETFCLVSTWGGIAFPFTMELLMFPGICELLCGFAPTTGDGPNPLGPWLTGRGPMALMAPPDIMRLGPSEKGPLLYGASTDVDLEIMPPFIVL